MKYKNPRLKHVKNISAISSALLNYHDLDDVVKDFLETISDQCNLLLETKKKKKCENCGLVFSLKSWKKCPMCNPSPQPEKCCDNGNFDDGHRCLKTPPSPQLEIEPQKPLGNPDISRSVEYVGDCIRYAVNKLTKTK